LEGGPGRRTSGTEQRDGQNHGPASHSRDAGSSHKFTLTHG
jgi:hypothetical protein